MPNTLFVPTRLITFLELFVTMAFVLAIGNNPVLALQETSTLEGNWHQWRGPLANGVAPDATPPRHWDEETNISWKAPIEGEGISTPIVWQGRVFVSTAIATDRVPDVPPVKDERAMTEPPNLFYQFGIRCLDLETGDTIWSDVCTELVPHEGRHSTSGYAAASPMTDGKRLVISFGSFGIFCYSLDGKKEWEVHLGNMHTRRGWGEATSPVLVDDLVVMNWDNEDDSFLYVLDANTGDTKWRVTRDEPTSWATPLIIERDGSKQIVTNGTNGINGYDLQTGAEIWSAPGTTLNAIPSPVEFGENLIFMAGYQGNRAVSIALGDGNKPVQNWELIRGTPYVPSPLLSENRLYFTQSNNAILHCVNAETGETFFGPQRLEGLQGLYGSAIAANGRVYLSSREGTTIVFADAKVFEVLATNQLPDQFDASPVAVGDRLLLRGKQTLYCIREQH